MQFPQKRKLICVMLTSALFSSASFAADDDHVKLSDIEVISTTPIGGAGLEADRIPTKTQSADASDIERIQSLDLSDLMNRTMGSVNISAAQNNPFQPNLNYRGFTASPLIGSAQGLSVYMDGIRVNEPFGDAVNFELLPESAIANIDLISGSDPLFGLNTLGGALSIRTKTGFTHPGHSIEAYTGSFGRDSGTIESGGSDGNFAYFVTGSITKEDGWRDFSPSRVEQFFTNLSYANEDTTLDFGITAVDSDLNGNGASPIELVAADREAVFTHPDNTQNKLRMFTLNGSHWINDETLLAANTYYRRSDRNSFNGDGGEFASDGDADGSLIIDDDGNPIRTSAGNVTLGDFDNPAYDIEAELEDGDFEVEGLGLNNRSKTEQDSWGFGVQTTSFKQLFGRDNQLTVGASFDRSKVDYSASSEIAYLTNTRGTDGTGVQLLDERVDGEIDTNTYSIFFTNTHSLTERLDLTIGGRYNWIAIDISGTSQGGTQDLNESGNTHDFKRFNPSVGATYALTDTLTTYANYSESNRAPTPSELTCAEPDSPCAYPNAFLADPPLDDVVARTVEAGLRGQEENFNWSAGVFYTELKDDLFFFNDADDDTPVLNTGVFDNIDKTARAGLELSANGAVNKISWFAHYSYVRATFEDDFSYSREVNEDDQVFSVSKGDRLPNQPEHNINVGFDYAFTEKLSLGTTASYRSSQYYRGDEANVDKKIEGYTVFNLHGRYKVTENFEFFGRVDNVFDNEYESFGLYGEPGEAGLEQYENSRFVGPGAPRAGWIGFKLTM
ncbi:TonB-dependent receptor [Methylophaga sp.]|uniref:TonB-dependent receptor n=1 Tax=Methylophaga sp. TaxID=2024840 RepID=UPI003A9399B2